MRTLVSPSSFASVVQGEQEVLLAEGPIPLTRVVSVSPVDEERQIIVQFEAEQPGFPSLALPMDQVTALVALLIGSSGRKGNDGKPVGVVSPDRCQVFFHPSDAAAIFLAKGIGSFDLAFTLDRGKATRLHEALGDALK